MTKTKITKQKKNESKHKKIAKKRVKESPAKKIQPKKETKTIANADKAVEKNAKIAPKTAVYLGLGSNVGDREEYIEQAITLLRETPGIRVVRRAANFETEPEGRVPQSSFINSAVEISTNYLPIKLLEIAQSIEDTLGLERGVEWGPRIIDIDILLYGNEVYSDNELIIPHPLMHERLFVLEPLKQIAPHVVHPVLETTIAELFQDKKAENAEKYDDSFSKDFER